MNGHADARPGRRLPGWCLLGILLLYTAAVHYGVGPAPPGGAQSWFQPRGFLYDWSLLGPMLESARPAMLGLGGLALALAAATALTLRSAVASAVAASCAVAVVLFAFYGVRASSVWEFFGWRGSAVILVTSAVVGFALTAPLLAASWLRRGWPVRLALYLPVFALVLAFMRNATGTDPSLKYSISPWPAVPVFGIELGAAFAAIAFAGAAVGAAALAARGSLSGGPAAAVAAAGLAAGLALPAGLLWLGGRAELLPFSLGPRTLAGASLAAALLVAGVALFGRPLARRARLLGAGAALVGVPLLVGHAWAHSDYRRTRDARAGAIIAALQTYYEREQIYPDTLEELVASRDLDAIPEPSIGFGPLYGADFEYQNFGTGYVLEFQAPRWVQCAYNPPWQDDEALDAEDVAAGEGSSDDAAGGDDASLSGAWSCPSEPPKLW